VHELGRVARGIGQDIQRAACRVRVEVKPSNTVAFGVGALYLKVTLPVSRPREPNVMAKILPPSADTASPVLARPLQNDGFKPAQIGVHYHVQHRHMNVFYDPRLV
jgi:hypothetical protein